jgi:Flp pilus assembly protein TadB
MNRLMKMKTKMLFMHILFGIIAIFLFVKLLFFQSCLIWLLIVLIIWISLWIVLEKTRQKNYHKILDKKKANLMMLR